MSGQKSASASVHRFHVQVPIRFSHFIIRWPSPGPVSDEKELGHKGGLLTVTPGGIRCIVGAQTSLVNLTVEVTAEQPASFQGEYEDVIERSYRSGAPDFLILDWSNRKVHSVDSIPSHSDSYRLRYHSRNMDSGAEPGATTGDNIGECLLQIWPAPHTAPSELKITSSMGHFWHPLTRLLDPLLRAKQY